MARKPKPAPLYYKKRDSYRLNFCIGKQYKGPYFKDENIANAYQAQVNSLVVQIKNGFIVSPPNMSLPDFVFNSVVPQLEEESFSQTTVTHLSHLIKEYQEYSQPPIREKTTCDTEKVHFRHLQRFLDKYGYKDIPLEQINVGFFNKYKTYRYSQDVKTDTVRKELGTFQVMFGMAVEHEYIAYNIVKDVKREASETPSDRFKTLAEIDEIIKNNNYSNKEAKQLRRFCYLTPNEIQELISLSQQHKWLFPIIKTYVYTGMRRGELIKLTWNDADLTRGFLLVRSKKQSKRKKEKIRAIDISDELKPTLAEQKMKTGQYKWVFTSSTGEQLNKHTLTSAFKRLIKDTKFDGLGFHVLRHSFASNLAAQGIEQSYIDSLMGHQTEEMRERYRHQFPSKKKQAINELYKEVM